MPAHTLHQTHAPEPGSVKPLPAARWLDLRGPAQDAFHAQAAARRDQVHGRRVFLRAVVELSNYCRQNCDYCGMRRGNKSLPRFRAERDTLRRLLFDHLPASVTDINIQTGEDPVAVREIVLPLLAELAAAGRWGLSVCLGTLDGPLYDALRQAGAGYYIIKLETGNEAHFRGIHAPGSLARRLEAIHQLAATGWLVSSGFIMGLPGQTEAILDETLALLAGLPLAGSSVSPFIPGEDTPLAGAAPAHVDQSLNALAALRLARPDHVIPAVSAFSILAPDGYSRALRAGANLATINMTPDAWRGSYQLYSKDRIIMSESRVLRAIEDAGLEPSRRGLIDSLRRSPCPI